jgi:hypothetical protein
MALKSTGRYDEALEHLKVAASQYPRDRVVLNQIGRILFLKRQYDPAIAAFQDVCKIDPEDLQAHYNLMLCYQGLGERESASREEALYKRFKADEASQFITGEFRQLHPADNNERQSIHEHYSVPLKPAASPDQPSRGSGSKYPVAYSKLNGREGSRVKWRSSRTTLPAGRRSAGVGGSLRSSRARDRHGSRIPPTEVGGSFRPSLRSSGHISLESHRRKSVDAFKSSLFHGE